MRNQKGFTLVELMIVVAIIGILAAIAIPKIVCMMHKGVCAAGHSEGRKTVQVATLYDASGGMMQEWVDVSWVGHAGPAVTFMHRGQMVTVSGNVVIENK